MDPFVAKAEGHSGGGPVVLGKELLSWGIFCQKMAATGKAAGQNR